MSIEVDRVAERANELRTLVDANATRPVTIVAVTKRFGADAVRAALAAGIADIGENYAQELLEKADALAAAEPPPRWHFIGHVQRNKVRLVADTVSLWQTVDSLRLGTEIAKRAPGAGVLVQVNLAETAAQSGVRPETTHGLVGDLRGLDLDVRGLMMIGTLGDIEASERQFRQLRAMADELELPDCSMGMSGDLEAALRAGSTIIRVGTGLFGPRPSG